MIYIPKYNLIIEVKSTYTYERDKEKIGITSRIAKENFQFKNISQEIFYDFKGKTLA